LMGDHDSLGLGRWPMGGARGRPTFHETANQLMGDHDASG
jgi:hypothetical protein